jgi:hypothetical protein
LAWFVLLPSVGPFKKGRNREVRWKQIERFAGKANGPGDVEARQNCRSEFLSLCEFLAVHPGARRQLLNPILEGRNATHVLFDVLLADVANGDGFAIAVEDRRAEAAFMP